MPVFDASGNMQSAASSLDHLIAALKSEAGASGAERPVDRWNPTFCGEAGLEILRDGTWRHDGVRMTRESLVKLFASILRKDEDGITYLVTPGEKIVIKVEDAPFLGIRVDRAGAGREQTLVFTTNVGDVTAANADHPIRVVTDPETGEPRPYVLVRGRLEARILRAPFYEMADWAETHDGRIGVWSGGAFFPIDSAS